MLLEETMASNGGAHLQEAAYAQPSAIQPRGIRKAFAQPFAKSALVAIRRPEAHRQDSGRRRCLSVECDMILICCDHVPAFSGTEDFIHECILFDSSESLGWTTAHL